MKPCSESSIRTSTPKTKTLALAACFLLALLFLCSLSVGSSGMRVTDAWRWILGGARGTSVHNIMLHVRFPRSIAALLCGSALAVSGLLLQSALNNPLASAGIIGINSGAGLFAVLSSVLFPGIFMAKPVFAFAGALGTAFLVFALAKKAGLSRSAIIMAGIALGSLLSALTDAVVTMRPDSLTDKNAFFIGGFAHTTMPPVLYALPMIFAGLVCAAFLAARLNVLALGDEVAASLGLRVNVCRYLALLCAALLAASAVCVGGLLGFVGLIVPNAARRMAGHDHKILVPFVALCGGALVTGCDILARILFRPFELPVGILLSMLGAPFFLFLVLRRKRRSAL